MTTISAISVGPQSDAELVTASRNGDREAFGAIVRRYQSMITGVIYSSCGDLHRSEDLAQETFVSAWKSLSGLRDASKLPSWLCQVARHRLLDNTRSESRHDARLTRAFHNQEHTDAPSPQDHVLSQEESELLWHTLREISQPYRETLVLYYRQEKSVEDVALAMDTTEANVRQRLTRGREMLREQVAAMLERNLVRSAPGPAFALAVVAALPVLIPQAATAATVGTVALKGTAAVAKGTGLLALLAMWIGPIFGVLGGVAGTWSSIRNTETPRERRFIVRQAIFVWIFVTSALGVLFGLIFARQYFHWSAKTFLIIQSSFWSIYACLLVTFINVGNRRHQALRQKEGLTPPGMLPKGGKHFGFALAGATVGALMWMVVFAARANDMKSVTIILTGGCTLAISAFLYARNRTTAALRRYVMIHCLAMGALTAVMLNWRIYEWLAAANHVSVATARQRIPLWGINLFVVVIYAFILGTMWASMRGMMNTNLPAKASSQSCDRD